MNQERAYLYGAFLGDGFVSNHGNSWYFALKVIDLDFADEFERCLKVVYPNRHISRYMEKQSENKNRNPRVMVKMNGKDLYLEYKENTLGKTEIPRWIVDDQTVWKPFLRGIMDSEGWVSAGIDRKLTSLRFNVGFAMKSPFVGQLAQMFNAVGASVASDKIRNELRTIMFNPLDYYKSGISFSIERKRKRLELIANTLNDFKQGFSAIHYTGIRGLEDKV